MSVQAGTDPNLVDATAPEGDAPRRLSLGRYVGSKVLGALFSLVMVVLLGFFAFRTLPGDPAISMTRGRRVTPDEVARLREEFGFNKPVYEQFFKFVNDLLHGHLGFSYTYRQSVSSLIGEFFWPTVLLTGTSALLSMAFGLWLGQKAAWKRDSWFDRITSGTALILWSVPTFWLGLLLLMVFGRHFATSGMVTPGTSYTGIDYVLDVMKHLLLPVISMVAVSFAQYLLTMRSSMLEEMGADYLNTARAKGLKEDLVRTRHALPNALLPTVTLVFMTLGGLIGGAITVETVFSWPGLGFLTFKALSTPDLPLLQGTFVVFSSIVIVMNLIADLLYRVLDPRLKTT